MSILDRLIAEDPNPELSNLDLLERDGSYPRYQPVVAVVRPVAHRRATHVRAVRRWNWNEIVSIVAGVAAIALMAGIIAAVLLRVVGA